MKIIKSIVREVLILLTFIIVCIIAYNMWTIIHKFFNPEDSPTVVAVSGLPAIILLVPAYPIYLIIRFIIWVKKARK